MTTEQAAVQAAALLRMMCERTEVATKKGGPAWWIPGVANGAMEGLLKNLLLDGWIIQPPPK